MSDPFKLPEDTPEGVHKKLPIGDFEAARGYSAGKRVVAVTGQEGVFFHTLYGASEQEEEKEENIAWRDWANVGAATDAKVPYVLDFKGGADFIRRVEILTSTLEIDERALLGAKPPLPFPANGWATDVVGELRVGGSPALVLRPGVVELHSDTELVAIENASVAEETVGTLVATMSLRDGGDLAGVFQAQDLRTSAAALFDRASDSGWEQMSPVWIATTEGFLRVPEPQTGTVPYGVVNETRPMDVTGWFQSLPDGAKVVLMLDRSGTKTLSVRFGDGKVHLRFEVDRPALDFVLAGVSCDTTLLTDPNEPPGAAAVRRGPALHFVSPALAPEGCHSWQLTREAADAELRLQTQRGDEARALYFVPHAGWVRPWEAAANALEADVSVLRVLIPMVQADTSIEMRVERQGLVMLSGSFTDKPDLEVTRHGPIACFQIRRDGKLQVQSDELSGDLAEALSPVRNDLTAEPAVLRPEYRMTPVVNAAGHPVPAPFAATYALRVPPGSLFSSPQVARPKEAGDTFFLRVSDGKPELRVDASRSQPNSFGWWDQERFFRSGSSQDHRLELLQARRDGDQWKAIPWLRLSDDSLVPQDPFAVPDPATLLDGTPANGWRLESSGLGEAGEGLSLFTLVETSSPSAESSARSPEFFLSMKGIDAPVAELKAPGSEAVVNRLVLAASPWKDGFDPIQVGAVKICRLNCLFLEFERAGGRFQVKRGMLGWTVSECFGLKAIGDLQFTEFYERKPVGLERTVEFNGGAKFQPVGNVSEMEYRLEVYFWSAMLQRTGSLRVMCKHTMKLGENPARHVVTIQDARVDGTTLDLSCDVAMFAATATDARGEDVVAFDMWETSRRGLFTVMLDQRRQFNTPSAFLKIRMASKASASVAAAVKLDAWLQPSWRESDAQVLPWFSAELSDRRSQTSWLHGHRLWTEVPNAGHSLSVTLYALEGRAELNAQAYRACTLGTPIADAPAKPVGVRFDVIPQWIPSPVKDIVPLPTARPDQTNLSRLWLFDPTPRTIAEWPKGTEEQDRQQATKLLAALGWVREAVLEVVAPADDEADAVPRPQWRTIDSPLLNRDATIGWLAWPLHKNIVDRPSDALPLTCQVVHVPPVSVREASVRVLFDADNDDGGGYRYPQVYRTAFPEGAATRPPGAEVADMTFWSPGLRAGVQHVAAMEHGGDTAPQAEVFEGWSMPSTDTGSSLFTELLRDGSGDLWLTWAEMDATLDRIESVPHGIDVLLPVREGAQAWTHVIFNEVPDGLEFMNQEGKWQPVLCEQPFLLSESTDKLTLRLEGRTLWSQIRLTAKRQEDVPGNDAIAAAAYFSYDALAGRLAAIFVDDQLRRFGYEPVLFRAPAAAGMNWTRVSGTRFPAGIGRLSVATIDMLNRTAIYE